MMLRTSGRFPVFTLAVWLVVCPVGPRVARLHEAQEPPQASTVPRDPAAITALMPLPRFVRYGDGWLLVKGNFEVTWLGYRNAVLDGAVFRFQSDVARRTGLDVGRGTAQLRIDCRSEDKGYLTIHAREGYSLVVKDDAVVLTADGPAGVGRASAAGRESYFLGRDSGGTMRATR